MEKGKINEPKHISEILNSGSFQKSVKPSKRPCEFCKSEVDDFDWVTYHGREWLTCKKCGAELREKQVIEEKEARVAAVVPPLFINARLESLPKGIIEVFKALPQGRGIYLWGKPGVGKSHAMCAFARFLVEKGESVKRINWDYLCLLLRGTFRDKSRLSELDVLRPISSAKYLIIEDLLVANYGKESDFSLRTLLVLLDERLESCRATFFTSNKPLEEIYRCFDGRVGGRIEAGCDVIELKGKNYREQRRNENAST